MKLGYHFLIAIFVLVAVIWEFHSITHAGFIYEDSSWIGSHAANPASVSLVEMFSIDRPLMRATWWWQANNGHTPLMFHLFNFFLHFLVSVLVGLLAYRIGLSSFGVWIAFIVFFLNPIQMETVAYLAARPELFAAIGVLFACNLLVGSISWWQIILAVMATGFGLLGKESAIEVIAFVPILRRNWPGSIMAANVLALLVYVNASAKGLVATSSESLAWALTQCTAAIGLMYTAVTLIGGTITHDYDAMPMTGKIASVVLLLVILALGCYLCRHQPIIAIGLLLVLTVVMPRLIVVTPYNNFNEHQFYLAMLGVSLILASAISGGMTIKNIGLQNEGYKYEMV